MQNAPVVVQRILARLHVDPFGRAGREPERRRSTDPHAATLADPIAPRRRSTPLRTHARPMAEPPLGPTRARPTPASGRSRWLDALASVRLPLRDSRGRGRQIRAGELAGRLGGPERILPVSVAGLVLVASILSVAPAAGTAGPEGATGSIGSIGNTDGAGSGPRIALIDPRFGEGPGELQVAPAAADAAGGYVEAPPTGDVANGPTIAEGSLTGPLAPEAAPGAALAEVAPSAAPSGPYLADGTLLKPVAVDTSVPDGSAKLREYRVRPGDTLTGIAARFGVSMMTLWWANELTSKDALHVGQTLTIPPVSGLVVSVAAGDTLDGLAAQAGVSADEIVAYNGLTDRNLVLGQTLVIPGAKGEAIPTPRPRPAVASSGSGGGSGSGGSGRTGSSINPPSTYTGGRFAWPVPGGYISQYFHYGHLALDIAAPTGTPVDAVAAGTVIFAGWRNNGGGYQVWLSHGSNLYTAYYHMSAVSVGVGQHVARGQQVGRVGMTGWATGPHTHFEVWIGGIDTGSRVNPLGYLR